MRNRTITSAMLFSGVVGFFLAGCGLMDVIRARSIAREGNALYNSADYRGAIAKYQEFMADPQNKDSTLNAYAQYNIALCYKGLYDKAGAMAAPTRAAI